MVYLSRPYPLKFLEGCYPQILLGPLLITLSHMSQLQKPPISNRTALLLSEKRRAPSRFYRPSNFKGCLPQILLGPLLNTLSHLVITIFFNHVYHLLRFCLKDS